MYRKHVPLFFLCLLAIGGCSSTKNAPMKAPEGDDIPLKSANGASVEPNGIGTPPPTPPAPTADAGAQPGATAGTPGPQPNQPGNRGNRIRTTKPEADKTVEGVYKVTEGSRTVEVVGVCKQVDKSISCWDPKGASLPDLAKSILAQAESMRVPLDAQPDGEKKTRMVVTKITGGPGDTRADLRFIGTETFGPGFNLRGDRSAAGGPGEFNMQRVQLFRIPATQAQTTATIEFRTPEGAELTIVPTKGATASYLGKKLTLSEIKTEGEGVTASELIFTLDGGVPKDMNAQVEFLDAKGERIRRPAGGPGRRMLPEGETPGSGPRGATETPRGGATTSPRGGGRGSEAGVRFGGMEVRDGKLILRVFGDLKAVGKISFRPNKLKNVDITKIAVDPK